jgi:hypothetical protein
MQAQRARTATCPACSTSFQAGADEHEVVCPACMNAFPLHAQVATTGGLPPYMTLEVKGANGEPMGLMDRHQIRQHIYTGRLKGREEVRGPEGWVPITSRIEFAEVFRLVGVDLDALRISQQQIQGWRKTESAKRNEQRQKRKSSRYAGSAPTSTAATGTAATGTAAPPPASAPPRASAPQPPPAAPPGPPQQVSAFAPPPIDGDLPLPPGVRDFELEEEEESPLSVKTIALWAVIILVLLVGGAVGASLLLK